MYNPFVEEQINAFERRQREQLAAMHRMAKLIDADAPKRWAQLRSILQGALAPITSLSRFRETSAAHERS
jgi:hypothetical protein